MTQEQEQRISTAARELSAALNDVGAEFNVRVESTVATQVGGTRSCLYSVEVQHLRPIVVVQS